jgi:hypothetical protein
VLPDHIRVCFGDRVLGLAQSIPGVVSRLGMLVTPAGCCFLRVV